MASFIESAGDIDIIVQRDARLGPVGVGDHVALVFRAIDANPPFDVVVTGPSGSTILRRVIRELPTGEPQGAPPVDFVVSSHGKYVVEIGETKGAQRGRGTFDVRGADAGPTSRR
jgi:hypothetical protein